MNNFDKLINEQLYLFDFEVTKFDWLLVIHKYSDNSETIFHNNSSDDVYEFINKNNPIFLAHNGRYYDQYILKAILAGFSIEEVKTVNDYIIKGGQGFEINYGYIDNFPPIWDTLQDIVPAKSLKEIEANLLLDITESTIDFNIEHLWTKKEYEEMVYYCRHDVDALRPLFDARKSYFKTKYDLCILSNIDPRYNVGLTNAKLCAKFLEAEKKEWKDERDYKIPNTIDLKYVPKEILDFFNRIHDKTISSEEIFSSKLEYNFHGMPSIFASGGAHGALLNYTYDEKITPDFIVINVDYSSLYPHLLALPEYNFISRNIKDKNKYYNTLEHRLQLKREGKKEEQLPLKLILNTTYGCQNNKYNDLYDPKGARGTCYTGQLMIASMTEEVYQIGDVKLIQINTDGLMVSIPRNKLNKYYDVCNNFSKRVKIGVEYDIIHKIIQRDVNNYIMIYGDNNRLNIKAKGGCFGSLPKMTIKEDGSVVSEYKPNFKTNSLAIVSEALARNLLFDTSIEDTINNCENIHMFQIVSHLGSTYEKCIQESPHGDIELQRNNRLYAGKKPSGKIIKVKPNGRRDSLANCPPNPIIDNANKCTIDDINKEWYIELAKQWANDFKGVKRLEAYKKDELLKMAIELGIEVDKKTKKTDLINIIEEKKKEVEKMGKEKECTKDVDIKGMNIYEKINAMKKEIMEMDFVVDCDMPNNLGGKDYASIGQYYKVINSLSIKYRLHFNWEVTNVSDCYRELFKPQGKPPHHVWAVDCRATFINLDNTEERVIMDTIANGSDISDKAISGGSSLAFRNWFDKNFTPKHLVVDEFGGLNEEVSEVSEQTEAPKIPTYIPPEKKEELTKEVVNEVQKEDKDSDDVKKVIDNIMKVRELSGKEDWGSNTLSRLISGDIDSVSLMEIELKVNNKLESLVGEV